MYADAQQLQLTQLEHHPDLDFPSSFTTVFSLSGKTQY
jgi:hypothetical protein